MGILGKLIGAATGGLGKEIVSTVEKYFPPDLSPEQKALIQLEAERIENERQRQVNEAIAESEKAINERIAMYEGTAKELKTIPVLGAVMIFLRGCQRIVWGYGTLWLDYRWFSGDMGTTEQQESALWLINLLVLGFLFGERAVKNGAPFVVDILKARNS